MSLFHSFSFCFRSRNELFLSMVLAWRYLIEGKGVAQSLDLIQSTRNLWIFWVGLGSSKLNFFKGDLHNSPSHNQLAFLSEIGMKAREFFALVSSSGKKTSLLFLLKVLAIKFFLETINFNQRQYKIFAHSVCSKP